MSEKHWVEDLFPPAFGFTLEEILQDKTLTVKTDTQEPDEEVQRPSIFAKVARRVSPLDVTAIKNVYERVWLMTRLEEEEKNKRKDDSDTDTSFSNQRSSTPILGHRSPKQSRSTKKKQCDAETSTSDINEKAPLDIHDPCIWSSQEINVLRAVFKTAKEQNLHLRAQLDEAKYQYEVLDEKYQKQNKSLESRSTKLKEAAKANGRLDILSQNLKQQVAKATEQIVGLQEQVKDMQRERSSMLKETHELRMLLDRERLDRKKAELELQHQMQEASREERIQQASLSAMHNEDVLFLQKTIEELTRELETEKIDHERSKRGLNHLRQHFSSLPSREDKPSESSVKQHELKQWTY